MISGIFPDPREEVRRPGGPEEVRSWFVAVRSPGETPPERSTIIIRVLSSSLGLSV